MWPIHLRNQIQIFHLGVDVVLISTTENRAQLLDFSHLLRLYSDKMRYFTIKE